MNNYPAGVTECPKCGKVCDSTHIRECTYPYFECSGCKDLFREENFVADGDLCGECYADAMEEQDWQDKDEDDHDEK